MKAQQQTFLIRSKRNWTQWFRSLTRVKRFPPTLVFVFVSISLEFSQSPFSKRFSKDRGYFPFSSFFPFLPCKYFANGQKE